MLSLVDSMQFLRAQLSVDSIWYYVWYSVDNKIIVHVCYLQYYRPIVHACMCAIFSIIIMPIPNCTCVLSSIDSSGSYSCKISGCASKLSSARCMVIGYSADSLTSCR